MDRMGSVPGRKKGDFERGTNEMMPVVHSCKGSTTLPFSTTFSILNTAKDIAAVIQRAESPKCEAVKKSDILHHSHLGRAQLTWAHPRTFCP